MKPDDDPETTCGKATRRRTARAIDGKQRNLANIMVVV